MANETVNRPSKSLMQRLASSRVVLWALATHGPRLAEIFNGPLGRMLPKGLNEFFEQHVAQLQEVLTTARDVVVASDRALRDQKSLTTSYRKARDAAFSELSPYVAGVRDTFKGACGPGVVEELGFALRSPEQPAELHEQADHLVTRLSVPDLEIPAIRFRGVNLDPPSVVEEMRPLVERLGLTLQDVARGERESEAMKIAKDEALDAYDRTFLWVARSAESLFKLAGLPEIAQRVRPSSRRPGVTDEVESQGSDVPADDPADDTGSVDVPTDDVPEDDVPVTTVVAVNDALAVSNEERRDIPPTE